MPEFLRPGVYRIMTKGCTAMIRNGENVLRGEPITNGDIFLWNLVMVHGGNSELVDAILTPVNGEGYLGVNYVKNNQDVYRLTEDPKQSWFLKQTDDGYTISQFAEDVEYYWYLGNPGESVIISDSNREIQSWVFEVSD
ncbi:hypothetical protein M405DRAFT_836688 [Rhizopogon salebrosus TDB-379]|nr:hypothetical protein M405DRAFT_836688 [Rhizopogon salebrosus TDB-379]